MGSLRRAWRLRVVLALCACAAAACVSTTQVDPIGLELNRPVQGGALRAWRLIDATGTLGYAIEFGDPLGRQAGSLTCYSVRNPWQQELGSVDGLGRAWRFQPHQREAEWLTSGTLRAGVQAILAAPPDALLEEVPLALLDGSLEPPAEPRH